MRRILGPAVAPVCLSLVLLISGLGAQSQLYTVPTSWTWPLGKARAVLVQDMNGNGTADFAHTEPPLTTIRFREGSDGSLLGTVTPGTSALDLQPAGDVDGDGRADVVARFAGSVVVYSGRTRLSILTLPVSGSGPASARGIGDVNADGHEDLALGWPANQGVTLTPGWTDVHSGLDGSLLFTIAGLPGNSGYVSGALPAGDVNGDGLPDLLIAQSQSPWSSGAVWIVSGTDQSVLLQIGAPPITNGRWASSVSGGRDLDGDGVPDLVITDPELILTTGGSLHLHSGATGALLRSVVGPVGFPSTGDLIGDVDGDGASEIVAGGTNSLWIIDGASGAMNALPSTLTAYPYLTGHEDITGDGIEDLLILSDFNRKLSVWSPRSLPTAQKTLESAGCGPLLDLGSLPRLGSTPSLQLSNSTPGISCLIAAGIPTAAQPLWPGCPLLIDATTSVPLFGFFTDVNGSWSTPLSIPYTPILAGAPLTLQALTLTAPTPTLTNALHLTLGY